MNYAARCRRIPDVAENRPPRPLLSYGSIMKWSPRRLLIALPIGLFAASIPLVANMQVDRGLRIFLYQNRSFAILGAVAAAFAALLIFAPGRVTAAFRSRWHRSLIIGSLLFPVFYAAVSILKGRVLVPVIGLYFVWSVAVFFVAPLIFGSLPRLRAAAIALLVANAGAWLLGVYLFETRPPVVTFEGRESFGYANPNSYAQILQVIACAAVYLVLAGSARVARDRRIQIALVGVVAFCAIFVFAARSRNVMAFGVAAIAAYHILQTRGGRRPLLIGVGALAAVAALAYADLGEIDRFSSGRLSIWKRTVDAAFLDGDDGAALLIGSDRDLPSLVGRTGYSTIRSSATFEKYHVDNFYLELVVEGGLIGTVLFLWPYALLMVLLWRIRSDPEERARANLALAIMIGFAIQGIFSPTFPSFNSPIGLMFAIFAVSPIAAIANRRSAPT